MAEHCRWVLDIILKRPGQTTSEVQKWRWIVERTFGWFGRERAVQGLRAEPQGSEAWIYIAMIHRRSRSDLPDRTRMTS